MADNSTPAASSILTAFVFVISSPETSKEFLSVQNTDVQFLRKAALFIRIDFLNDAVPFELRTGRFKPKGDTCRNTLFPYIQNPIIIAHAAFSSRFARDGYMLQPAEVGTQVYRSEQWRAGGKTPFDGIRQKQRQPVIGRLLILDRTAEVHVAVAIAPIRRERYREAVDPFGQNQKLKVGALFDHSPGLTPPLIGFREEKIGGKARGENLVPFDVVFAFRVHPDRPIELIGFLYGILAVSLRVGTIKVAVFAAIARGITARPRFPIHASVLFGCGFHAFLV